MPIEDEEKHNITEKVMQQYEDIRSHGYGNMFDQAGVASIARGLRFKELSAIADGRKAYKHLLMNFSYYMKKYNIKQISSPI